MTSPRLVDLFSDTVTRPPREMRAFMAAAEVGDEQRGLDPTVNLLQEMVADLLGKEAALFLPSGTMCNQISFAVHCRAGDEIIMDVLAHPYNFEAGGPTALVGAGVRTVAGDRGRYTAAQVEAAIRRDHNHDPRTRAISVEQTTNIHGGAIWPLAQVREVCAAAERRGLRRHLDGARLLNAVVATGIPAREWAATFESAWVDLSKGLGAPVGAVLAGSRDFIEAAWPWKHRLGGAMRQAGIIAAAGVYALRHNVERLADDHANAKTLAKGLAEIPGIRLDPATVETNIVVFDIRGTGLRAEDAARRLEQAGVSFSVVGPTMLRAVTHLDVSAEDVQYAVEATARGLGSEA